MIDANGIDKIAKALYDDDRDGSMLPFGRVSASTLAAYRRKASIAVELYESLK